MTGAGARSAQLQQEVDFYRGQAFAQGTKRTYQSHLRSYFAFCSEFDVLPVPASEQTVAQYAAYLARRLKPASVKQYLNIIRILHLECQMPNPCKDSWHLKMTLKGIEKVKGTDVQRKQPVTPHMLIELRTKLDFSCTKNCVFWAACLTMFFGLLRKSNLFGTDSEGWKKEKHLTRECVRVSDDLSEVSVQCKWSKTNQSGERVQCITLPGLASDHPLCPVAAITTMYRVLGPAVPDSQAFPMTGSAFNKKFRACFDGSGTVSSHSLRRGGATWALSCGTPGEIVKLMGDWKSVCYLVYLDQIPSNVVDNYRRRMSSRLPWHL